eukprot:6062091-Amphidinium_carterae.1
MNNPNTVQRVVQAKDDAQVKAITLAAAMKSGIRSAESTGSGKAAVEGKKIEMEVAEDTEFQFSLLLEAQAADLEKEGVEKQDEVKTQVRELLSQRVQAVFDIVGELDKPAKVVDSAILGKKRLTWKVKGDGDDTQEAKVEVITGKVWFQGDQAELLRLSGQNGFIFAPPFEDQIRYRVRWCPEATAAKDLYNQHKDDQDFMGIALGKVGFGIRTRADQNEKAVKEMGWLEVAGVPLRVNEATMTKLMAEIGFQKVTLRRGEKYWEVMGENVGPRTCQMATATDEFNVRIRNRGRSGTTHRSRSAQNQREGA